MYENAFFSVYMFSSVCLSPVSGGRDEQEGLAAVRRICEEDKEAKGNKLEAHKCFCRSEFV